MTRHSAYKTLFTGLLLAIPAAASVNAASIVTGNLHLQCGDEPVDRQIHCQYRLVNPAPVNEINAQYGNSNLNLETLSTFPDTDSRSAILFLVDTSDPAREAVIRKNRQDIEKILAFTRPHHQFALARFDKGLVLEAPMGSATTDIVDALQGLHAVGKITELYRSLLSAIDLLEKTTATRKAIYLFSDGLAEDRAYYHDDVVKAAKKAGVIINSLGYPRSISQSVSLQTIRRLSEETGGLYIETGSGYRLPNEFISNPFATIDNGGRFALDISPLVTGEEKTIPVTITVITPGAEYQSSMNIQLPPDPAIAEKADKSPAESPPRAAGSQQESQPVRIITHETETSSFNKWFWYGIPSVLIILLIATIFIFLLSTYRQSRKKPEARANSEYKPYAYLVLQDASKKRYPVTRTTWRIGRGNDNEMTLPDSSVSRRHAEIHRDKGDLFTIYDLDSLNGVYINNNKVSKSLLHEGDIIEIGDINLRFTLLSTDYSVEESTIMQNTRTPLH